MGSLPARGKELQLLSVLARRDAARRCLWEDPGTTSGSPAKSGRGRLGMGSLWAGSSAAKE